MLSILNHIYYFFFRLRNKFRKKTGRHSIVQKGKTILYHNFKKGCPFTFIQIGANDGVSFDFLFDFVTEREASGYVIEPIDQYFKQLVINYQDYPNIKPLQFALHPSLKELTMYKVKESKLGNYPDWVYGIASLDKSHLIKNNIANEDITENAVKALSVNQLFEMIPNGFQFDYLQIDTEGFDYEILKMIDFNVFKPKMIRFESVNLSREDQINAAILLKSYSYHYFIDGTDSFALDLAYIKMY